MLLDNFRVGAGGHAELHYEERAVIDALTLGNSIAGAAGDGVTDDTSAIQDRLNQGGYVSITNTHLVGPLTIPSNTVIDGRGVGKLVLKDGSNADLLKNSSSTGGNTNIHIRNLRLDGNASQQDNVNPCHAVGLYYVSNASVSGCTIENTEKDGVYLGGLLNKPCRNVIITGNHIETIRRNGVSVVHGYDIVISNNHIYTCNIGGEGYIAGAVDLEPNVNQVVENVVITGNNFRNAAAPCVKVYASYDDVRYIKGVVISNNTCTTEDDGIHVRGYDVEDITITGNVIRNNDVRFGIILADRAHDISVIGNVIIQPGTGVFICQYLYDITMLGNTIRDATGYGIQTSYLDRAVIANNVIHVTADATAITYIADSLADVIVDNNVEIQDI